MDPKEFSHRVELDPSSASSLVSTGNLVSSDPTRPQSVRRIGRETSSVPATSKETTLKRAAKLYCILGERVQVNLPSTSRPLVRSNEPSSMRVRKITGRPKFPTPEDGEAKAPVTKNEGIETVERFAREGLIKGSCRRL